MYVFVQPVSTGMPAGDHEISRHIHNEVIYSDVFPQGSSTKGMFILTLNPQLLIAATLLMNDALI